MFPWFARCFDNSETAFYLLSITHTPFQSFPGGCSVR
jgi:hypothetical protein